MRAFYQRIAGRRGNHIAAVAVARKLAVIIWHLLKRGEDYAWVRPALHAKKLRDLELRSGQPARGGQRGMAYKRNLSRIRLEERRRAEQAETAYKTADRSMDPARETGIHRRRKGGATLRAARPGSHLTQFITAAWPDGVGPRRTLLHTEIGLDGDVTTTLPADLAPQRRESLTRLAEELTSRSKALQGRVPETLSGIARDPDRSADLFLEGLAERLGLPPALLTDQGLQLGVPQLTDEPTPLTPPRAGMRIDLHLGSRLRVRITPEALGAEGDVSEIVADIWAHFGLSGPAVA